MNNLEKKGPGGPVPENTVRAYVGRGSPLGNPFSHREGTLAKHLVATRDDAIWHYRDWLIRRLNSFDPSERQGGPEIAEMNRLFALVSAGFNLELACWCVPAPCHAEVIKDLLERRLDGK